MAPHCEIHFHNSTQGVFHAGQMLSGSVVVRLDKPKLVNDFRLVISGYAEIQWSQRKSKENEIIHTGKEELMRAETYLIPQSNGNTEIPAGEHVYNFATRIPTQAPTSFEGQHGNIRYTVRVILERPWKLDQTSTVGFTVLKPLDLNQHLPTMKVRRRETLTKTFRCWPCTSSPLYVGIEIPVTGYVPGQKIPITVILNNTSGVPVSGILSKLKRKVSYISQWPRKISRVFDESLASMWTPVTNDEFVEYVPKLEIPTVVPSGECSVIVIKYMLKVEVHVGGCHRNLKYKIPITIGTIPFTPSPTTAGPNVNQLGWTDGLLLPTAPESPGSPDDILPPNYAQALNGMV